MLGVDIETFGFAVARHWGLGDEILHMMRRLPVDAPVRKPDGDADLLRLVASAANEIVDAATQLPAQKMSAALDNVSQRYARVLKLNSRAIVDALQEAKDVLRKGGAAPAGRRERPGLRRRGGGERGAGQTGLIPGVRPWSQRLAPPRRVVLNPPGEGRRAQGPLRPPGAAPASPGSLSPAEQGPEHGADQYHENEEEGGNEHGEVRRWRSPRYARRRLREVGRGAVRASSKDGRRARALKKVTSPTSALVATVRAASFPT